MAMDKSTSRSFTKWPQAKAWHHWVLRYLFQRKSKRSIEGRCRGPWMIRRTPYRLVKDQDNLLAVKRLPMEAQWLEAKSNNSSKGSREHNSQQLERAMKVVQLNQVSIAGRGRTRSQLENLMKISRTLWVSYDYFTVYYLSLMILNHKHTHIKK